MSAILETSSCVKGRFLADRARKRALRLPNLTLCACGWAEALTHGSLRRAKPSVFWKKPHFPSAASPHGSVTGVGLKTMRTAEPKLEQNVPRASVNEIFRGKLWMSRKDLSNERVQG